MSFWTSNIIVYFTSTGFGAAVGLGAGAPVGFKQKRQDFYPISPLAPSYIR
jgi:hypothetical protein